MRITRVESVLYRFPPHREIFDAVQQFESMEVVTVEVHTDEGVAGLGLTYTIGRGGRAVKCLLDTEVLPLILGADPRDTERLWETLWWKLHWVGRQGIFSLALSAVDIALWDLKAKKADQPLYKLLGGHQSRIPAYNTDGGWLNHTRDELVREAASLVDQGFTAVKIKVGKADRSEDVSRVRAVRKEIGASVRLMVDANMCWTAAEAMARGRMFEEFDLFWLEEPIEADDVSGHVKLREGMSIPIAVGESLYNRFAFREYLTLGGATILQPDVGRVGGVTEWMRIAKAAHVFNTSVAPHFLMELHVHLACAVPNTLFVEHIPFLNRFVTEPLEVEDGHFTPPDRPGHGLMFDPEKAGPHCVLKETITY